MSQRGTTKRTCKPLHRMQTVQAEALHPACRSALRILRVLQVAIECDGACHYSCNRPLVDGRRHHM